MTLRKLDISGPKGNAFYILGVASMLGKQLEYNTDEILQKMKVGSYEDLLREFNHWFDDVVTLVSPIELPVASDLYTLEEETSVYL